MNILKIDGLWDEGYSLDLYNLKSTFLGEDVFGRPQFDSQRSELGELIYRMKYNGHENTVDSIIKMILPFVSGWLSDKHIDIIIAVPPSRTREFQPVFEIVKGLAKAQEKYYATDILMKLSEESVKNIQPEERDLKHQIIMTKTAKRNADILLVDDVIETKGTANECVRILKEDPLVGHIYFLALTRRNSVTG